MDERRRILTRAFAVMALVSLGAVAVAIFTLYGTALEAARERLSEIASNRASMIAAVARFDAQFSEGDHPAGAQGATLSQLREAQGGFGETGEFVVVRQDGEQIVFLSRGRDGSEGGHRSVEGADASEAIRLALGGESGTIVALDARGEEVLAAYEPLPELGWGVVAKMDLAEVRAPFVRAGLLATAAGLVLVAAGAGGLLRLVRPPLRRIDEQTDRLVDAQARERGEAEELTRSVLDAAIDSVITIDRHGAIEAVNGATVAMFGYDEEELIGQNVSMLMPAPYRQQHDSFLKAYLDTGAAHVIGIGREVPCQRKDGSTFPGDLAVSELNRGEQACFTGIMRDLTERKKAEQDLRDAEQRVRAAEELASVGTLVAGLAHEIGTPMGVIQGHAKLLERKVEDERARWRLQTIQEQIGRISKIIQSLLNMARPKANERIPISLEPLLDTTLSFLSEKLARRRVEVVRDFEPTNSVIGDPERLQQLLLNLFLNAIDAMPEGGELRIQLRPDGQAGATLRVADTGVGIAAEDLDRIFEAFYTSKEAGKGNGLGLMVASRIVADHGGVIEVESAPGEGTAFLIRLPWNPLQQPAT